VRIRRRCLSRRSARRYACSVSSPTERVSSISATSRPKLAPSPALPDLRAAVAVCGPNPVVRRQSRAQLGMADGAGQGRRSAKP
jgi:hypothetical protein